MGCNYDGGDCCGDNVDTQYCSVCECLDGGSGTTTNPVTTDSPTSVTTSPSGLLKIQQK